MKSATKPIFQNQLIKKIRILDWDMLASKAPLLWSTCRPCLYSVEPFLENWDKDNKWNEIIILDQFKIVAIYQLIDVKNIIFLSSDNNFSSYKELALWLQLREEK